MHIETLRTFFIRNRFNQLAEKKTWDWMWSQFIRLLCICLWWAINVGEEYTAR